MNFKKLIFLGLSVLFMNSAFSQDLLKFVPNESFYVMSMNGKNMSEKVDIDEISNMPVMQEMLRQFKSDQKVPGLRELGVNWESEMHFFVEWTDSMSFFGFVTEITDEQIIEKYASQNMAVEVQGDGSKLAMNNGMAISWDQNVLIMLGGNLYNYDYYYGWDNYYYDEVEEAVPYYEEETIIYESEPEMDFGDEPIEMEIEDAPEEVYEIEEIEEYPVEEEMEIILEEYPDSYTYEDDPYMSYWDKKELIEQRKIAEKINDLRNLTSDKSLNANKGYMSSYDDDADVMMFSGGNSGIQNMITGAMYNSNPYYYGGGLQSMLLNSMSMYDGLYSSSKVMFENDQIKISNSSFMSDDMFNAYQKICDAEVNEDFMKFIPSKKPLAFYSFAMNTEEAINEMPSLVGPMYQMYLDQAGMDIQMENILKLYSVIIDEEAIGKVINGDGMLVLNSIRPMEVEYTTYDWDDNWNPIEKTEMRTENVPDFLMMFSTEDEETVNIIFDLIAASDEIEKKEKYYQLKANEYDSFQLFMTVENGIIFFCNSPEQINYITSGGGKVKLSKDFQKEITGNTAFGFFDGEMILKSLPEDEFRGDEKRSLEFAREEVRTLEFSSSNPSNGKISGEILIEIPGGHNNSLQYLFDLLNEFYKIDKNMN